MCLKTMTQKEVIRIAEPMWQNLIQGSVSRDYPLFSRDFSTALAQLLTVEKTLEQWQLQPGLTRLKEQPECLGVLKSANGVRVLWRQAFTDTEDECLGHMELVDEQGEVKIDGAQIF